ncbi:hypothetical protein AB1N83_008627 [Pleurotus pulmonarius]
MPVVSIWRAALLPSEAERVRCSSIEPSGSFPSSTSTTTTTTTLGPSLISQSLDEYNAYNEPRVGSSRWEEDEEHLMTLRYIDMYVRVKTPLPATRYY